MAHAEAPDRLDMARSEAGHPAPARGSVATWTLWFGFLGAPLGWTLQTLANTAVASHGCYPQLSPLRRAAHGRDAGHPVRHQHRGHHCRGGGAGGIVRTWRRTSSEHQEKSGSEARQHGASTAALETGEGRTRFMALSGVLTSIVFLIVILAHTAAVFVVIPCGG